MGESLEKFRNYSPKEVLEKSLKYFLGELLKVFTEESYKKSSEEFLDEPPREHHQEYLNKFLE